MNEIEDMQDEDEVLRFAWRVHENSLTSDNELEKILKEIKHTGIEFELEFSKKLEDYFRYLKDFYTKDERNNFDIHSFVTLGGQSTFMPFVLKAYDMKMPVEKIGLMCSYFELLSIRQKLIRTRADLEPRLNELFRNFSQGGLTAVHQRVDELCNAAAEDSYNNYWNNDALKDALKRETTNRSLLRHILWKYEIYLRTKLPGGLLGYKPQRFDDIACPELEHISPQNCPDGKHGYDTYNQSFINNYLNNLGNYLLVSKEHNIKLSNAKFKDKCKYYTVLKQQEKVVEISGGTQWKREQIKKRREELVDFIKDIYLKLSDYIE